MLASRLVSSAYQPSVAASASMASWSNHQVRAGLPGPPLPVPCQGRRAGSVDRGYGGQVGPLAVLVLPGPPAGAVPTV